MKSIAFDKEINDIRYEIKWKLIAIDKKSTGNRCEIISIQQEIRSNRYENKLELQKNDKNSIENRYEINSDRQEIDSIRYKTNGNYKIQKKTIRNR